MTDEILDLDAIREERKPIKVKIRGKIYKANPDPSVGLMLDMLKGARTANEIDVDDADAIEALDTDEVLGPMRRFLVEVFGEAAEAEIFHKLGVHELRDLVWMLMDSYGVEGKAPGSNRASRRNGARSSRTSAASTKSTSGPRASARNGSTAQTSRA